MQEENITYLAQLLTNIETLLAEADQLFLELQATRTQGILINKKLNKAIINIYELLDSAVSMLFEAYQIKMNNFTIKKVSHKDRLSLLTLQHRRLISLLKKINNQIDYAKMDLKKLKRKVEILATMNILEKFPPNELIIDLYNLGQILLIITLNFLAIKDTTKDGIVIIPLENIREISFKRSIMFRGCEIKLRDSEKVKIPLDYEMTLKIKRRISLIKKFRDKIRTSHLKFITKRSLIRPDINLAKIMFLKAILNKHLGLKTKLI